MFEKVTFEINGNSLDEYDDYAHVFHREFGIKEDKMSGYLRCCG
jgi:hypothetical protein